MAAGGTKKWRTKPLHQSQDPRADVTIGGSSWLFTTPQPHSLATSTDLNTDPASQPKPLAPKSHQARRRQSEKILAGGNDGGGCAGTPPSRSYRKRLACGTAGGGRTSLMPSRIVGKGNTTNDRPPALCPPLPGSGHRCCPDLVATHYEKTAPESLVFQGPLSFTRAAGCKIKGGSGTRWRYAYVCGACVGSRGFLWESVWGAAAAE